MKYYSEDLNDQDSLIPSRCAERLCSWCWSSGMVAVQCHFVTLSLLCKLLNRYRLVAFIWALTWRLWIANNLSMGFVCIAAQDKQVPNQVLTVLHPEAFGLKGSVKYCSIITYNIAMNSLKPLQNIIGHNVPPYMARNPPCQEILGVMSIPV